MKRGFLAIVSAICLISVSNTLAADLYMLPDVDPAIKIEGPTDMRININFDTEFPAAVVAYNDLVSEPSSTSEPLSTAAPVEAESTAAPVKSAASPTETPTAYDIASAVNFDVRIIKHDFTIGDNLTLELYSMDDELLSSYTEWIDASTENIHAHFDLPEYKLGTSFKLKNAGGVNHIKYYDKYAGAGNSVTFQTYGYFDDNNNYIKGTDFSIECDPKHEKGINIYMPDGLYQTNQRARLVDGVAMVPVRQVAEKLGLKVKYDKDYNSVTCSAGSDEVIFNIGDTYTTVLGNDIYAPHAPCYIGGSVFVPLRTLAESIGSTIDVYDYGDHLDIAVGASELVRNFRNQTPVNRNGISSDTSYLVWISKHEFKVRVYTGSQYQWELAKEFPCAIGAPGSETITGTFKYQYRMARWEYNTYYVGPALVFYGNYAMHSTLLNYGGGEYDGTVGAKISHGCVRLHPQDINWIDCYVPVKSTVYITE